jgi:subtilisin family serine protease
VCGDEGCFSSDSVAAVQQAISDGVDVINFSISGGGSPYADAVELAFLDAYNAGVFVAASAGNSGPAPETTDHRGPWVTTIAASHTNRFFLSHLSVTADGGATLELTGASITEGIHVATPVVQAKDFDPDGNNLCDTEFPAGTFSGQIVLCQVHSPPTRIEKGFNVLQGGASGMIIYNEALQGIGTDNHHLPAVMLEVDKGQALLDFLSSHTGVTATFTDGEAETVQGDVMAAFSSRGGPGQTLGISKPDVTAPGVQILAGNTPLAATVAGGPEGELFQAIRGTSMSSPHAAGAGALLAALHPDWTPGQIKSALMTSARTQVLKEDETTPANVFDMGSGRIDLSHATSASPSMRPPQTTSPLPSRS